MPRSISVAAARNARRPLAADLRVGRAPSLGEALDLLAEDELATRQARNLGTTFVSAEGLAALIEPAMATFTEEAGLNNWPHNFVRSQMSGSVGKVGAFGRRLPDTEAKAEVERFARLGGWIRAAAKLPGIKKLLRKGMTRRGVNSPYCHITPMEIGARFPSPGRFERLLWATKARAEAVLSAYNGGLKPSWVNCARALLNDGRPNKAGIIAAAAQMGFYINHKQGGAYRAARAWLVENRSAAYPVADATDGVVCRLAAEPELNKLGITVSLALVVGVAGRETGKREVIRFVRKGERTYHSRWGGATEALHEAIRAWKRQDELALANADLVSFLNGETTGACPLVFRTNSYAAGNCSPGTESWLREMGWTGRDFIPGVWLIAHLHDDRVRRVVVGLMPSEVRNAA